MTDHRLTDLSYGHLGEATYDIDTQEWRFSLGSSALDIQQLLPLRFATRPSIPTFSEKVVTDFKLGTKWLIKSRPETFPANAILRPLARTQSSAYLGPRVGQLLAIGYAKDVEQTFGSRKTAIIATACGEAGHVLRLIKPRIERHEWGRESSARLSLMDLGSSDQGYWVGTGGRILQITYSEDASQPDIWLAVRQANATTIFRPIYGANTTPAVVPNGHTKAYPSSRINANPVAIFTTESSGSRGHADVAFNPWYTRQFAVVDELGSWSVWDIEGGQKKNSIARLLPGKSANIFDDYVLDPTLKVPDNADGWHQILWVGTVSTIVVCNRRHFAVFDIKAAPTRLQSRDFFTATNSDWILDLKRSPSNLSHLFVLTSSRIFWLEVIPGGEEKAGDIGFKILLSYRHFRDANDKSMRLAVLRGEEGRIHTLNKRILLIETVSVTIYSEKLPLLNIYTFSLNSDVLGPTSCHGSLNLIKGVDDQDAGIQSQMQTLFFLETPLRAIPNRLKGTEYQYIEEDVKFYQLLVVGSDLGLSSGVCTMQLSSFQSSESAIIPVTAPTRTYIHTPRYMSSKRIVDEPWIIPDGQDDEPPQATNRPYKQILSSWAAKDDTRLTINFRSVFQEAFGRDDSEHIEESWTKSLEKALNRMQQEKKSDELAMTTFLELCQIPGLSEDLEQAAPILRDFFESLKRDEEPNASSSLTLSNLTLCPGIRFQTLQDSGLPDLLKVYDEVAENWIASLPLRVPGLTRLAKFKIARKVAVELCLSSIGASLRNNSSAIPVTEGDEPLALPDKSAATSRATSPALFSSQIPQSSQPGSQFCLPTPAQTPSLYSQSHASASEYAEDPAILRLRQYVVSIKSKPDLGTSKILSQWPAEPRVDPATYSWEEIQKKAAAEESGEEDSHKKRREDARRKRKTERFLSRESTAAAETSSSQPVFMPFGGSQPDIAEHAYSSQTIVDDVPMTQPDRGAFGSRTTQQGKKKLKKKRTAGFR
jgi:RNA polymerase I-specific transcription initiation factor RRN6